MKYLANILTALNLIFGFSAILLAIDGHASLAAWLIVLAVIMDAFDGKAARFFGGSSPLGLQFDSMADVVSMGVAPSVLCYIVAFREDSVIGMVVCTLPVLAAAFRLARFNVKESKHSGAYEGLTSPLHACLISTFVILNFRIWGEVRSIEVLAGLLLLTALLMVSKVPIGALPRFTLREQGRNSRRVVILALCIGVAMIDPPLLAFPVILLLIASAAIAGQFQSRRLHELADVDQPEPFTTRWKNP